MYVCVNSWIARVCPEMTKVIGKVVKIYEIHDHISCILCGQLVGPSSVCDDSTRALA